MKLNLIMHDPLGLTHNVRGSYEADRVTEQIVLDHILAAEKLETEDTPKNSSVTMTATTIVDTNNYTKEYRAGRISDLEKLPEYVIASAKTRKFAISEQSAEIIYNVLMGTTVTTDNETVEVPDCKEV